MAIRGEKLDDTKSRPYDIHGLQIPNLSLYTRALSSDVQIHMHLRAVCRDDFVLTLLSTFPYDFGTYVLITLISKDVAGDMRLKCRNRVLK